MTPRGNGSSRLEERPDIPGTPIAINLSQSASTDSSSTSDDVHPTEETPNHVVRVANIRPQDDRDPEQHADNLNFVPSDVIIEVPLAIATTTTTTTATVNGAIASIQPSSSVVINPSHPDHIDPFVAEALNLVSIRLRDSELTTDANVLGQVGGGSPVPFSSSHASSDTSIRPPSSTSHPLRSLRSLSSSFGSLGSFSIPDDPTEPHEFPHRVVSPIIRHSNGMPLSARLIHQDDFSGNRTNFPMLMGSGSSSTTVPFGGSESAVDLHHHTDRISYRDRRRNAFVLSPSINGNRGGGYNVPSSLGSPRWLHLVDELSSGPSLGGEDPDRSTPPSSPVLPDRQVRPPPSDHPFFNVMDFVPASIPFRRTMTMREFNTWKKVMAEIERQQSKCSSILSSSEPHDPLIRCLSGPSPCAICLEPLRSGFHEGPYPKLSPTKPPSPRRRPNDDGSSVLARPIEAYQREEGTIISNREEETSTTSYWSVFVALWRRFCCCESQAHAAVEISLPCSHRFHESCIRTWLTEAKSTCPLCMADVMPDFDIYTSPSHRRIRFDIPERISEALIQMDDELEIFG